MSVIFKRKLYNRMLAWKNERKGSTALLVKGARRVGKSTLVEQFAKEQYRSYILVDFAHAPKNVTDLFEDMYDLDFFFMQLQIRYGITLHQRESVIIFDEVQLQPLARQAIKYLVKDGRYDYIETGSLLTIKKNVQNIVIPSEETRLTLFPLDYEEFRWAMEDDMSCSFIRMNLEKVHPLGDVAHRKLMRDFRLYLLVGGMPQSVNAYIESKNLSKVDTVKREILELYEDDFRKIDKSGNISLLFDSIPAQLSKNATRYVASSVIERTTKMKMSENISELSESMTVNIAYHANDLSVGLSLHKDPERYKLFVADTGLFVTLAFKDKDFTENIIYEKMLSDKLSADLGYIYENAIAQMLKTSGNELFYYTFKRETSNHPYEIDFLISKKNKICPIEVKSSGYKSHVSMDVFCEKYPDRIFDRYLLYTKDVNKEQALKCLPVYMTPFL